MRKIHEPKKLLHKWMSPLTMVDMNDPVAVSKYFEAKDKAQLEEERKVADYNECVRKSNEECSIHNSSGSGGYNINTWVPEWVRHEGEAYRDYKAWLHEHE